MMWGSEKLTTAKVRGQEFDVYVDTSGKFFVKLETERVEADSLEKLKDKLSATLKTKSARIEVKFTELESNGNVHAGAVTGVHVNGNMIARYEGQKGIAQLRTYSTREFCRPLTNEERAEWRTICTARKAATAREESFRTRTHMDIRQQVSDAMAKVAGKPEVEL